MCARLNSNIFGTFLPYFLVYTLQIGQSGSTVPFSIALVPLVIYSSSTFISTKLSLLYNQIGRKNSLILGTVLSLLSLGLLFLLDPSNNYLVYPLALLIGCSQSLLLATSINLTSDVVGSKGDSGAVVFGVYSFLDKVSAGVLIYSIALLPCFSQVESLDKEERHPIRWIVIGIPMLSAALAGLTVLIGGGVSEYGGGEKLS